MVGHSWIADPPELIRAVELDGLLALFHRPSGLTHILAAPAPQILAVLAGRSGDSQSILTRITERFDVVAQDVDQAVAARLAELEAAGLIRRA